MAEVATNGAATQLGEPIITCKEVNKWFGEFHVLHRTQQFHIAAAAGTKWFHRERMHALLPQIMHEHAGENGFSNARVRARDEDDFFRLPTSARFHFG